MATIEIDETLLREYVFEMIADDEELKVDDKLVNQKISEILAGLKESPEEIISDIVLDQIYFEVLDEEDLDEEIEDKK